ncbi:MAG: hypothetical protein ACOCRO_06610 [Halanaerobiales bacterium]
MNKITEFVSNNVKIIFDVTITVGVILAVLGYADPNMILMIMIWAVLTLFTKPSK